MRQFVLTTAIHADIKSAYDIICRPEAYQALIPEHYPSVRTMSVRGDTSVAEEHVVLGGRELTIMAKHVASPPHRHETFVIGGDAKGSYILHELAEAGGADDPGPDHVARHQAAADQAEDENDDHKGGLGSQGHERAHAAPGRPRTVLTTTIRIRTGRLSALSDARRVRSYQESFLRIIHDLARASGCTATSL